MAKQHRIPVLAHPAPAKAPPVESLLRAGTITTEPPITVGDVTLPPVFRGIQTGKGCNGEQVDYPVRVTWVSRPQIDAVIDAIEQLHPDLGPALAIVRRFMLNLDTMRDEMALSAYATRGMCTGDSLDMQYARQNLDGLMKMAGNWHDERRIYL